MALTVSGNTRLNVAFTAVGSPATAMRPYAQAPLEAATADHCSLAAPGACGDDAEPPIRARSFVEKIAGGFVGGLTDGKLKIKDAAMLVGRRSTLTDGSEAFFPVHDEAIQEWSNVARNGDAAWNAFTNQNVARIIDALRPRIVATVMSEFVARLALLPEADRLPALRCILNDTARGGVEAVRAWRPQLPLSFPASQHDALEKLLLEYNIAPQAPTPTPMPTPTDDTVNASLSIR
ncbi:hypothetical protein UC34_17025 [Pandoraea vervacti]|uniref:Uncharacterized protein n=2 Tax=Pandoraea vervacti TaxID=656178 RepID=A0ABM5T0A3_9BURK|nr:hypothetical protein UC34_17025 [Pandoraea vervacti]